MSSSTSAEDFSDLYKGSRTIVVNIRNAASGLCAYAPGTNNLDGDGKAPLIVEPNSLRYERNETWLITVVRTVTAEGATGKRIDLIVTIKNLGTRLYAWDVEDPPEGEPVYEKAEAREWRIERAGDGHYLITPTGPKENVLFWTELEQTAGSEITLQKTSGISKEKRHWSFPPVPQYSVNDFDDFDVLFKTGQIVVKMQNVSSKLWAYAPDVKNLDSDGKTSLLVEPDSLQYRPNEFWLIELVRDDPRNATYSHNTKPIDPIVTIKNIGTGLYAWDVDNPPEGVPVYEKAEEREWKIERTRDSHYKITPTGPKLDVLFWTDLNPVAGSQITLERDVQKPPGSQYTEAQQLEEEKRHWYIYTVPVCDDKLLGDFNNTVIDGGRVRIQNASSGRWAKAHKQDDFGDSEKLPVCLGAANLQDQWEEEWLIFGASTVTENDKTYSVTYISSLRNWHPLWCEKDPAEGDIVYEYNDARYWKIAEVSDGNYKITPMGHKKDILFWADVADAEADDPTVTLEKDSTDETESLKRLWHIFKTAPPYIFRPPRHDGHDDDDIDVEFVNASGTR